jgi:hypothetical protein
MTQVRVILAPNAYAVVEKDCPKQTIKLLYKMITYVNKHPELFTKERDLQLKKKTHKVRKHGNS